MRHHSARAQVNVTIGKTAFTQEIADVIRKQDGSLVGQRRRVENRIKQEHNNELHFLPDC